MSYNLADILRFFSITKNCYNELHLNVTLNQKNIDKQFELSLQILQTLSLDIRSLSFLLEVKSHTFVEELIVNQFPDFFFRNLNDIEYLTISVPHDDFGLLPYILQIFKRMKKIKSLKLMFSKCSYFHLPYQFFITTDIDDFLMGLTNMKSLEMNIYFSGSLKEIYPRITHLTLDISYTVLQHGLLIKLRNFPNLIKLSIFLTDHQAVLDFFSIQVMSEFQEILENLRFINEIKIVQGESTIILDTKRALGLKKLIKEIINRPYLIECESDALEQISEIVYDENKEVNQVKKFYSFLKKNCIPSRVRLLSIANAFNHTKLRKTFKRKEILCEILKFLI